MVQAYGADTDHGSAERPEAGESRFRGLWDTLRSDRGVWRRGIVLALCSVLLTLLMVVHAQIPNRLGNLGSLVETFLPWVALFIPVLLVLGLVRRSATAVIALLLPAVVWLNVFGGLLTDKSGGGGDLTVATHNVNAGNPDPDGTAQQVAGSGADVVALQELRAGRSPRTRSRWPTATRTTRSRAPWACGASIRWPTPGPSTSRWAGPGRCARRSGPRRARSRCTWPTCRPSA